MKKNIIPPLFVFLCVSSAVTACTYTNSKISAPKSTVESSSSREEAPSELDSQKTASTTAESSIPVLTEPPGISLSDSLSSTLNSFAASSGSYEWSYLDGADTVSVIACGIHPLDQNIEKTEALHIPSYNQIEEVPYLLSCDTLPDRLVLMEWDATQLGNSEAAPLSSQEFKDSFLLQLRQNRVYELSAFWEKEKMEDRGFYGSASYIFLTSGSAETP